MSLWKRCRRFARRSSWQVGAWCALVGYLFGAAGLPLPVLAITKAGPAFPCQHRPCGCASAEECWDHCCCFSAQEKLAWAAENHVTPPAKVVAAAEREALADASDKAEKSAHACCAHHHDEPDEHEEHAASCCSRPAGKVVWTSAIALRNCRSLPLVWISLGAVTPAPARATFDRRLELVGHVSLRATRENSPSHAPPSRPPQA